MGVWCSWLCFFLTVGVHRGSPLDAAPTPPDDGAIVAPSAAEGRFQVIP